jgi:hypothetical protein
MSDIHGKITLADQTIEFACDNGTCSYTVSYEKAPGHTSSWSRAMCPQASFLKALAIAVHNDGMPDYNADYPDAETVQPTASEFRFIP